jgi:hypothetical protein
MLQQSNRSCEIKTDGLFNRKYTLLWESSTEVIKRLSRISAPMADIRAMNPP